MSIAARFREHFARHAPGAPVWARAPGRLNLIGEHTDYNEGFVLPVAIDRETCVAFAPGGGAWRLASAQFPDEVVWPAGRLPQARQRHWSDYVCGVLQELAREIALPDGGMLWIESTIPAGAGLSSSAALEVAVASAVSASAGASLPALRIARLCRSAENDFVGANCGIMDMLVSTTARPGHATWIDCRSEQTRFIPLPEAIEVVMADTGVRHALADGEYNRRREECERACRQFAAMGSPITALRDVDPARLETGRVHLDPVTWRRARHVVTENRRVLEVVAQCERLGGEAADEEFRHAVGAAFAASHESLRSDYEVSCPELDELVAAALGEAGIDAARMTGGGFGGSIVALRDANIPRTADSRTHPVRTTGGATVHTEDDHPL